jgi:hypothetical protein
VVRFAATYPLLLPWAWLAWLPGLSVEAVGRPLAGLNLGLLGASAVLMLRHPERRHLADRVAGTRVERVPPPAVRRLPAWDRMPLLDRAARVAVGLCLSWAILLAVFGGGWAACWFWLQSERAAYPARLAEREAAERERREAAVEAQMRSYKGDLDLYKRTQLARGADPRPVQLYVLSGAYRMASQLRDHPPRGPSTPPTCGAPRPGRSLWSSGALRRTN